MAKKYALVPADWIENGTFKHQTKTSVDNTENPNVSIIDYAHELKESDGANDDEIVNLLPKRYRNRASILLHYIREHLHMNKHHRVIYSDGTVGSHIIDLLKYFLYPKTMKTERPLDAPKFYALMLQSQVPRSTYVGAQSLGSTLSTRKSHSLSHNPNQTHAANNLAKLSKHVIKWQRR